MTVVNLLFVDMELDQMNKFPTVGCRNSTCLTYLKISVIGKYVNELKSNQNLSVFQAVNFRLTYAAFQRFRCSPFDW